MSEEEREYLNEMIRSLNNRLVDALRERDEARREVCKRVESASCLSDGEPTTTASDYASWCGWDCFKNAPVVKTLNGVVVSKGKAVPPKFELGEDDQ